MGEMIFGGWQFGQFTTEEGRQQPYCNAFFAASFAGEESGDYHFGGMKAIKKKAVKPEVWAGIEPNTRVFAMFDSNGRLSRMEPVKKA